MSGGSRTWLGLLRRRTGLFVAAVLLASCGGDTSADLNAGADGARTAASTSAGPTPDDLRCESPQISSAHADIVPNATSGGSAAVEVALRAYVSRAVPGLTGRIPDDLPPESDSGFSFRERGGAESVSGGHALYRERGSLKAIFELERYSAGWFVTSHAMCPELEGASK